MKRTSTCLLRLLLIAALFSVCGTPASGQGWFKFIGKTDPSVNGILYDGRSTPGGYAFVGNDNGWLTTAETDPEGNIIRYDHRKQGYYDLTWGRSLVTLPGGGYTLLAGHNDTSLLLHVAGNGQTVWQRNLSTQGPSSLTEPRLLDGGDYLITGTIRDTGVVMRLDPDGHLIWQLHYARPGGEVTNWAPNESFFHQTSAHTYIRRFWVDSLPGDPAAGLFDTLVCFNTAGYFEPALPAYWAQWNGNAPIRRVIAQPDGNFLVMGYPQLDSIRFLRVHADGVVFYDQRIRIAGDLIFGDQDYAPTADGGLVLLHTTRDNVYSCPEIQLTKLDQWGVTQWISHIDLPDFDDGINSETEVRSLHQAANGNYILCGNADFSYPTTNTGYKPLILVTDSLGRLYPSTFYGQVQQDENLDCQAQETEQTLAHWPLQLEDQLTGQRLYRRTDSEGAFVLQTEPAGLYNLHLDLPNPYWSACLTDTLMSAPAIGDTVRVDFQVQPVVACPFLEVAVGTRGLRRCMDSYYTVQYCNTGTAPAENAYIRITLDPYQTFLQATLAAIPEGNGVWRFDLGAVPVGFSGAFGLTAHLDCDSTVLGQTHCVEAHIYPDSICVADSLWSGANVDVSGDCDPDSVRFVIRNTGTATTSVLGYVVIEDNIINYQGNFVLPAGNSLPVSVPANGHTWRVEAEQEPGSPYDPMPSATVEACGVDTLGGVSLGYVLQFAENDGNPFVSMDCHSNTGSFDPNEKFAVPAGYGPQHFIRPGQPIEYQINFQNTGTDTAFYVAIRDTLAEWLDPGSIVPGASSHSGHFEVLGSCLKWTFEHILLPDSNVNEAASHGFVKFSIRPRTDVPLGAVIRNRAGIYFDFNPPVITNETWHTVGEKFVTVGMKSPDTLAGNPLEVFPNPAAGNSAVFFVKGHSIAHGRAAWFNQVGQCVETSEIRDNRILLPAPLRPGLYRVQVFSEGELLGWAKWVAAF